MICQPGEDIILTAMVAPEGSSVLTNVTANIYIYNDDVQLVGTAMTKTVISATSLKFEYHYHVPDIKDIITWYVKVIGDDGYVTIVNDFFYVSNTLIL